MKRTSIAILLLVSRCDLDGGIIAWKEAGLLVQ
jgi:hypothetical protein